MSSPNRSTSDIEDAFSSMNILNYTSVSSQLHPLHHHHIWVGSVRKFKEVEVDADNESKEESDTEGDYTSGSDSEDSDYDPKHDEVFDDDEHIVKDVHASMNNFSFTADPKHDLSIGVVEVHKYDLDVIDYDSFDSDLDDGIDFERRIQLRELRRIGKQKKQGFQ
ncbi:hypothetical protein Tco_1089190 [Tanacetum coccineum]